ncbi:MAG: carbonic anhydrase family protein [Flavobacteriales bacterium]
MKAQTKESQNTMTPAKSLHHLKEGNARFQKNLKATRNLIEQVKDTGEGQFPFATVLSCIDSRVSAELVFDQGVGDVFSIRIAGNFVNEDILGSMEFACKLAGTRLVVVLGHTACGAVKGACDDAKMGNLTGLLDKIKPAVSAVTFPEDESLRNSSNSEFVNTVSAKNVQLTIDRILKESGVLSKMHSQGEIQIVGAMYDVKTGAVTFSE